MKFIIDSEILDKKELSIVDFSVILYYLGGGTGVLNDELCSKLWNKDYLIKTEDGYIVNNNKYSELENITAASSINKSKKEVLINLANKLRAEFPEGKKAGTNYYWKDSPNIIAQRLSVFFKKYGDTYTNDQIVDAAKRYVASFNGNYQYMQLLKYFISKQNKITGEDNSELASYLANEGQEDEKSHWEIELK